MSSTEDVMSERLVRVETKLDVLIAAIEPRHIDHENRLRKVEAKLWVLSGIALSGGTAGGALIAHLTGA